MKGPCWGERTYGRGGQGGCHAAVFVLAVASWACAGTSPPRTPAPGVTQDVLTTQIRTITTGEVRPEQREALRQIALIQPGAVQSDLRTALSEAFMYAVLRGGSKFEDMRGTLENLLIPLYSTEDLAAALYGIPSGSRPTAEETTAAVLTARLPPSDVGHALREAMSHAVSGIAGDHYPYRLHSVVLLRALAELFTDEELTRLIGSIETVPLTAAQVAAIRVSLHHWGHAAAPRAQDPPGPELSSAMMRAVGRLAEIESAEASERERLETSGDLAGQRQLRQRRLGRGLLRGPSWGQGLARVFERLGDTVVSPALAATVPGLSLVPFGEAAIPPAVAALRSPTAHTALMRSILADLAEIAAGPVTVESGTLLNAVALGFLNGETFRQKGIADRYGRVFEPAIDLAIALEDPSLAALVRRLATDPEELVRVGMVPRSAEDLVWRVRGRIDWSPAIRSPDQLIAVLRTIPSSSRPSLTQQEVAVQLEEMPAEEIGDELRSAMIEAWAYTQRTPGAWRWYHVHTPLTNVLVADYSPADVVARMRALIRGEGGPEQGLAIEAARRWRGETPEAVRVVMIEALEHLNDEAPNAGEPDFRNRHQSLADAVDLLADRRAVPALVRAGVTMVCGPSHVFSDIGAAELARALTESAAPPRLTEHRLLELGYISAAGGFLRLPEPARRLVGAVASRFLGAGEPAIPASASAEERTAILKAALYLAVATADVGLADQANRLATDVATVQALGLGPSEAAQVSAHARDLLAARPLLALGDC